MSSDEEQTSPVVAFKNHLMKKKQNATEANTKTAKDWSDDEVSILIDMLEENACLWDVFHKEYAKRDVKEIAYTEIATALNTTTSSVKTNINGLRAQLGRELAKENKTKSGQSTDELYSSGWIHYNRLAFLLPVIGSSKSRDTLKRSNVNWEDESGVETGASPAVKKKTITEKKLDLLSRCTEAITANTKKSDEIPDVKRSAFSLYVEEKLSLLDRRNRRIAEKRISDILFEIEMSSEGDAPANRQMSYGTFNNNPYVNMTQGQSYMDMLTK